MNTLPFAARAEVKAVEHGLRVRLEDDGSLTVKSESVNGLRRRVTFRALSDESIQFECSCPSGEYRGTWQRNPCWHSARAARFLEHKGLARWTDAVWYVAGDLKVAFDAARKAADEKYAVPDEDLFRGL